MFHLHLEGYHRFREKKKKKCIREFHSGCLSHETITLCRNNLSELDGWEKMMKTCTVVIAKLFIRVPLTLAKYQGWVVICTFLTI